MRHINAYLYHYDPRDYRTDSTGSLSGVLSGFVLLSAILAAMFFL
jgi:hypothetical protein